MDLRELKQGREGKGNGNGTGNGKERDQKKEKRSPSPPRVRVNLNSTYFDAPGTAPRPSSSRAETPAPREAKSVQHSLLASRHAVPDGEVSKAGRGRAAKSTSSTSARVATHHVGAARRKATGTVPSASSAEKLAPREEKPVNSLLASQYAVASGGAGKDRHVAAVKKSTSSARVTDSVVDAIMEAPIAVPPPFRGAEKSSNALMDSRWADSSFPKDQDGKKVADDVIAAIGKISLKVGESPEEPPGLPLSRLLGDPEIPLSRLGDTEIPLSRLGDTEIPLSRLGDPEIPLSRLGDREDQIKCPETFLAPMCRKRNSRPRLREVNTETASKVADGLTDPTPVNTEATIRFTSEEDSDQRTIADDARALLETAQADLPTTQEAIELQDTKQLLAAAQADLSQMTVERREWQRKAFALWQQAHQHLYPLRHMMNDTAEIEDCLLASPTFTDRWRRGEIDGEMHSLDGESRG